MSLQEALTSGPSNLYPRATNGKIDVKAVSTQTFVLLNPGEKEGFAIVGSAQMLDYFAYRGFDITEGWQPV